MNDKLNLDKWQKTVELLAELYGATAASIVKLEGNGFEVVCTSGRGANRLDTACTGFPLQVNSYCKRIMETGEMLYVPQGDQHPEWQYELPVTVAGVISYLGFPIRRPDHSFYGTICVKSDTGTDYSDVFVRTLEQFRDLVEADLQLAAQAEQLQRMAHTDEPTGCANRRGLQEYVERRLQPTENGWGVLYLDLDNLKATNDRFGHSAGDEAIELMGRILLETARSGDLAARVGGDEFVLLASCATRSELEALRSRIVGTFELTARLEPQLRLIGVSVGTSYFAPGDCPPCLDALLADADARMYDCKRTRKARGRGTLQRPRRAPTAVA